MTKVRSQFPAPAYRPLDFNHGLLFTEVHHDRCRRLPSVTYFKRYRMEIDPSQSLPELAELPAGYFFFVAGDEALLPLHAEVKYRSFVEEIDSTVFPSLASRQGCRRLMQEIRRKTGFCAGATWLIGTSEETCGTVQGVCELHGVGAIQNLGITRRHRGKGLGKALLLQSLHGFRCAGVQRVDLKSPVRMTWPCNSTVTLVLVAVKPSIAPWMLFPARRRSRIPARLF